VSFALLGSLLEAFGVLPSHAAEILRVKKSNHSRWVNWSALLQKYLGLLRWSLVNRYLVSVATVCLLVIAIVFASTRVPFQLFGQVNIGQFFVNIEAPSTYSLDDSKRLAVQAESAIREVVPDDELKTMLTNVGVSIIDFNRFSFGSHYIQLVIDLEEQAPEGFIEKWVTPLINFKLSSEGKRERTADDIIDTVRQRLVSVSGIQRLSILRPQGGPAGSDIEVGIRGSDVKVLHEESIAIRDYLRSINGIHDVSQDLESGKLEYQYSLNDRGRQLGLTQRDLADAVRSGFLGLEVTHVTWKEKRIPVRVIYPDSWRHTSSQLAKLRVTSPLGKSVYLGEVADISVDRGLHVVKRRDGGRLAKVTAEVDSDVLTPLEASDLIRDKFGDISERRPGYSLLFLGEKKEASDSIADMKRAGIIALAIIYFILVALFRSLLDPLVVMFAIPFGIIGVIAGHILFGYNLQFLSLVGFLALSGIVVNDSLILIDFAKKVRQQGWQRIDAVVEAGRVRIRPILLTTITTFLGVSPLIFFASGQTAFLSPMAVSLGFGLIFATVLILVALPCFYLVADDIRIHTCRFLRGILNQPEPDDEQMAPICLVSDRPVESKE